MSGKRTFLTLMKKYEFKQEVDEKKITKTKIARQHGIPKSTLFMILKTRVEILNAVQKEGHNLKAKNFKVVTHVNLDQVMLEWFSQHRVKNVPINEPMMQRKADEFSLSAEDPDDPPPVDTNSKPGPYTEQQPGLSTAPSSAPPDFHLAVRRGTVAEISPRLHERLIATCLENRVALYSPHTSWDVVKDGVNDWLARAFGECYSHIL
uniref:NIF3-like protein 1 n=1 Tax=Timema bartmani TaxID=61472 RepID=A0A7R9ERW3_9NEOP|nr:unnamed protein product [Timema bartmani]